MVGTVTGLTFALTTAFSGLSVGGLGMGWSYLIALGLMTLALVHLASIHFAEPHPERAAGDRQPMVDVRGALDAIRAVPGLIALMLLAAFNNLLIGVFMALMDSYGLSLVAVETWGLLLAFITLAFIGGGVVVARRGVGANPLRLVLTANLVNWTVCSVFALQSSIILLTIGMVVWLALIPVIEASEQTVLQRSIPFERQGRVFGFAQLMENAATPLTAFLMAPLAETVFMPTMTDGVGADLIGGWFGTGPQRGIALMFTLAGLIGVAVTLLARTSRSLRQLDAPGQDAAVADQTPSQLVPVAA
jgi:DHA3 family multidrug efflux protein-like MFS transporter